MGLFLDTGREPRTWDGVRILAGFGAAGGALTLLAGGLLFLAVGEGGHADALLAMASSFSMLSGVAVLFSANLVRLACWRPFPRTNGEPLLPPELLILWGHILITRYGDTWGVPPDWSMGLLATIWVASGAAHFLGALPLLTRKAKVPTPAPA